MAENSKIKIIKGFPNYAASKDGFIWSNHSGKWLKLKLSPDKSGRLRVNLGRGNTKYVHRLILETFKGKCPKGMEGCHNDGDNSNNYIDNLRWDTSKSNMNDQYLHGTRVKGDSHSMSKISEKERILIINKVKKGEKQKDLAKEFGITQPTVSYLINNYYDGKY